MIENSQINQRIKTMRRCDRNVGLIISRSKSKSPQATGFTKKLGYNVENNGNFFNQDNPTERKNKQKTSVSTNPPFDSDSLSQYPGSQQMRQNTNEKTNNMQYQVQHTKCTQDQFRHVLSKDMLQTKKRFKLDFSLQNSQFSSLDSRTYTSKGSNQNFDGNNTDSLNKYKGSASRTKDPIIEKALALGNIFKYLKDLKKQCISESQKQKFSFVQDCLLNIESQVLKKKH